MADTMNKFAIFLPILIAARAALASESSLSTTYQPLDGLGSGVITVVQVTCHHWNAMSSVGSVIDLIDVRNVPPTDNPTQATQDLNLASRCGLKLSTSDLGAEGAVPMILMDATKFDDSKAGGYSREDIVRASLECLRRCLPEKLKTTKITLSCRDADRDWLSKIASEFDSAPRDKPFYEPM
jgi:hypothetical protein